MLVIDEHISLAPFTTFGIGGPADYFVIVHSAEELEKAISLAKEKQLDFFVLGKGANILVGDKGFRGLVIKNDASSVILSNSEGSHSINKEEGSIGFQTRDSSAAPQNDKKEVFLIAESGAVIADLIAFTIEKGLSGLEHYAGIPSTLGGALWQNLHFLSPDRKSTMFIGDILESAEILTKGNKKQSVAKRYFKFGYDYSSLHDNKDVVLSAKLRLTSEDSTVLRQIAEANLLWRKEKHPENAVNCSAGSVFKKIEGHGAGRLIEQVGLKGKQIGGAKISEKHANFIVNAGGATAQNVRDLIDLVQTTVKKQLDLHLQTEISFIGEF